MMKVLSSKKIRQADAYTIENEPIASIDLMERACEAFVGWYEKKFNPAQKIIVVCGTGNNGGDGLGIARLLLKRGYRLETYVIRVGDKTSADFEENEKRLSQIKKVHDIRTPKAIPSFCSGTVVIDAIFGSGLSKPVEGLFASVIKAVNQSMATTIAVDISSGLFADSPSEGAAIIRAAYTVSFQLPKLAFFMPQNAAYVGKWTTVDIGLSSNFIEEAHTPYYMLEPGFIKRRIKKRDKFAHKGNFGKALLIAGSLGKIGAAVLSSKACLRAGAGLLTSHTPQCGYTVLQTAVPEAMVSVDPAYEHISAIPMKDDYQAVGIGPGIGTNEKTTNALTTLLSGSGQPLVLDADALNILGKQKDLLSSLPAGSVLTPHVKEFERLAGESSNDFQRLWLQLEFSKKFGVYIVLKGAHTAISTPDGTVYFNTTGNPGMATAGSGDVLTGIITGFLSQGYSAAEASFIGVYIHGLAGDIAAAEKGYHALIASDIIGYLPEAFKQLAG